MEETCKWILLEIDHESLLGTKPTPVWIFMTSTKREIELCPDPCKHSTNLNKQFFATLACVLWSLACQIFLQFNFYHFLYLCWYSLCLTEVACITLLHR